MALALLGAGAAAQTTVDLSIDQARGLAQQALVSNDPGLALQVAEAILQQLPDDRSALAIVAAAAPRAGDATRGRRAGARAWAVSTTDTQKYEAARLTALAAANEGRFTLATFWLRRALTVAPSEDARDQTLRDARAVRQRNPLSTQLSFSLVPSSNLNGGAEDEASTAPGNPTGTLSEDALALAGWRASLSFGAQYRVQEARTSRTTLGIQYQGARVRITDDTDIPDQAFATDYYELSARHDRLLAEGSLTLRASRGLYEYRNLDLGALATEYENYAIWRLGVDRNVPLNQRTSLSFSVGREWLRYRASTIGDVDRLITRVGANYRLDSRDVLSGTMTFVDSTGDSVNYTSQDLTLSTSYRWADPIGPITLSVGGGLRWSDYPDYRLLFPVDGGRQDETVFANANIGIPEISYAGFTPGLRIDLSRTDSNVSRFDRTTFSAGFTLSSQF